MISNIIYVKSLNDSVDIGDFFKELNTCQNIARNFMCARLGEIWIRDILRNYISKNGLSSLFHFSLTCDAILHDGIHVDEIEELILGFVRELNGAKYLLIIDPYFYSTDPACVALFGKMMMEISRNLERVTFITNGRADTRKAAMHDALRTICPTIEIKDVITDQFHDRFWVDPDNKKGIVMGTSLNGIGKKIALIDHLSRSDVVEIAGLAQPLFESGT
jgi:hypothetical protein